jgi:hypothetical protein
MCPMCAEYIGGSWFCPSCAASERRIAAGIEYQELLALSLGESAPGEETTEGDIAEF